VCNTFQHPHHLPKTQLTKPQKAHGGGGESVTYAGLTLRKASGFEYGASKALGAFMWFWVFYMLYNNWEHKVYGLPYVFEREGLDDDDDDAHGHGHGHGKH
jgi:hypothetical protein